MSEIEWLFDGRSLSRLQDRSRSAADLMALAAKRTGLHDFGPTPVAQGLERLMASLRREARLSLFGRLSAHWDNLRLLKNLLILRDRERVEPAILARPVARPIFVMGLPRSGTSYLHALLAEDEASQAPRCWQAIYPYADHPASGRGAGPERVQQQFRFFQRLAPEIRSLHPFDAYSPQECTELTAHSFASQRFDINYDVPSYRRWLRQGGHHHDAYALHRRFLQHLQGPAPRRWVLKSPDHVFALDALRAAYPDARIVISHRDPIKVLPSVARLTEVLRRPFSRRVDRAGVGAQVVGDWVEGAQRLVEADASRLWPADQVFHVHFRELTGDPAGVVGRLYRRFGLEMTPAYERRIADFVAARPRGGYGRNVYRFADFDLKPQEVRERFSPYMAHFGVEAEGEAVAG